jgi:hypothetical protein
MSELLYFAGESEIPHILMKLDITKAFDKLEGSFLLPLLEHLGFGPYFLRFLKASYNSSISAIRINGQLTKSFPNKRSVRQGCPMSSLLFLLCADSLSTMLQKAQDSD